MPAESETNEERRVPLSTDRVLRAAIKLADEGGLDSLSMRKLARELGVEAMSIYYHVSGRDEILDAMLDLVVQEMEVAAPGADWKASLRRSAMSAHLVLERHPWACGLMMAPARVRAGRMRFMEGMLGRLREAGLSAEMTDKAYHALDSHIIGSTLWEVGYSLGSAGPEDYGTTFLNALPPGQFPYLAEHVGQHMIEPSPDDEGAFGFGLNLILDGIERMLGSS